jgi:hypothetical protein
MEPNARDLVQKRQKCLKIKKKKDKENCHANVINTMKETSRRYSETEMGS